MSRQLNTDEEISSVLDSGDAVAVVGLNQRGLVQLQLPPGNDYIVLDERQAIDLLICLMRSENMRLELYVDAPEGGSR